MTEILENIVTFTAVYIEQKRQIDLILRDKTLDADKAHSYASDLGKLLNGMKEIVNTARGIGIDEEQIKNAMRKGINNSHAAPTFSDYDKISEDSELQSLLCTLRDN